MLGIWSSLITITLGIGIGTMITYPGIIETVVVYSKYRLGILQPLLHSSNIVIWPHTKHSYKVTYTLFDKDFAFIVTKRPRNPNHTISDILDEKERSVYKEILPFLGPNLDFHGSTLSPLKLGYNQLKFIIQDTIADSEHIMTYYENETIVPNVWL